MCEKYAKAKIGWVLSNAYKFCPKSCRSFLIILNFLKRLRLLTLYTCFHFRFFSPVHYSTNWGWRTWNIFMMLMISITNRYWRRQLLQPSRIELAHILLRSIVCSGHLWNRVLQKQQGQLWVGFVVGWIVSNIRVYKVSIIYYASNSSYGLSKIDVVVRGKWVDDFPEYIC